MLSKKCLLLLLLLLGLSSTSSSFFNRLSMSQKVALTVTGYMATVALLRAINLFTYSYQQCIDELTKKAKNDWNKLLEPNKTAQRQREKSILQALTKFNIMYPTLEQWVKNYLFPRLVMMNTAIGIIPFIITCAIVGYNSHKKIRHICRVQNI